MNNFDERQQQIWEGFQSRQPSQTCAYANLLATWAEPIVSEAERRRDLMTIYQAKLMLMDKFFLIRSKAPKTHRFRMSETGHFCIWHRFEEYYNRLDLAQMALTPPLYLPEPKEPTVIREPRQIGGFYIGEDE